MIVNQQYSDYTSPLETSSMSYPNILTPPSSSEDSPQPIYLFASPESNTFEYENYDLSPVPTGYVSPQNVMINPNVIKMETQTKPSLHLIEQPTDRFRFRYKSEMAGTHGSLTGINSDKSRKPTYPTVELKNCTGRVIVRCSIYQSNANCKDFLPHAHRLIMKKGKEEHDDPHDIIVGPEDGYTAVFQGMGIIHTAKKNIVTELIRKKTQLKKEFIARTERNVRELNTKEQVEIKGLAESESKSINLNIVCLRFDAFIKENGILYPICDPIFSHGINNLKSALTGDLKIVRLDHVVSPANGNKEIFILVERVTKKNIKIRFYELDDEERVVWDDWGKFNDLDVHHQYAIVFRTPKYKNENITSPVKVFVELYRPTDGARSEPREFRYIPNKSNSKPGQKRPRYDYSSSYNSSELNSEELPLPINNLQIETNVNVNENVTLNNANNVVSDELWKAMNNIDSDEFQEIFSKFGPEFTALSTDSLTFDAPLVRDNAHSRRRIEIPNITDSEKLTSVKLEVSNEEKQMAMRVVEELRCFIKTTHTKEIAIQMLEHYFGEDKKTNALHITICQKDKTSALMLLKIIAYYKRLDLLENTSSEKQTPLHLAILCFDEEIIHYLLLCKCRIAATDNELNTVLHLAIKSNAPINILEMLLRDRDCERINEFIDLENESGNTPLVTAVGKKSLSVVKLLNLKGADVNKTHPKNGFVPLRFAIENKRADLVRFFLSLPYINATIKDFQSVSPLTAAMRSDCEDIRDIVKKYMEDHGIILEIKEEPEDDDTEDEMEIDEDVEIKTELPHLSPEELEKMYEGVKGFTSECLDEISSILDKSENWKNLAEVLGFEHLITSGMLHSHRSMSKDVLTYSVETNNDTVWMIRNFLENLDEFKAVEIIDRMVLDSKKN